MAKKKTKPKRKTDDTDKKEKADLMDKMVKDIEKQFGKGSVMRLSEDTAQDVEVISTGSLSLDHAIGVGGVPKGRITEIYGSESSGKTTLGLHIVANSQKKGGIAAYVDAEHSVDPKYAEKIGVNVDDMYISQPDNGEQALEIVNIMVSSGIVDVIVIDSVAALVPRAELEGEMGDVHMGLQARLMSQAMRKLSGSIKRSNTCVVFINQVREKIGVIFGSPLVTPGGRALKFYASVRLQISRIGAMKEGDVVAGNKTKVKVVKNKVAAPFKEAEFQIMYNKGICMVGDILTLAEKLKVVKKVSSWYSFKGHNIGNGYTKTVAYLEDRDNSKTLSEITAKILTKWEEE